MSGKVNTTIKRKKTGKGKKENKFGIEAPLFFSIIFFFLKSSSSSKNEPYKSLQEQALGCFHPKGACSPSKTPKIRSPPSSISIPQVLALKPFIMGSKWAKNSPKTDPERRDVVQQRRDVVSAALCNVATLVLTSRRGCSFPVFAPTS